MATLAIDIGGTNTRVGLFAAPGICLESRNTPNAEVGRPYTAEAFLLHLEHVIGHYSTAGQRIDAIGLAIAAVVDPATGFIHVGENVGWRELPLGRLLGEKFGIPVQVDTDAFCGALGEARLGAGADWQDFLYVTIGTGIGHGFILNQQIWHGVHAAANVLGHLKVVPHGEPCYCGGFGCLCMYASGSGIARLGQRALAAQDVTAQDVTAQDVVWAAGQATPWAKTIIDHAVECLAAALSSAYNLMDIEGIVIDGGAVSTLYPDLQVLSQQVEAMVYPRMRPIAIRRGKLTGESVLQGAALLAFDLLQDHG